MRGQVAIEYMTLFVVIAFALLVVAYFFYSSFQTQARTVQARIAVDRIAGAVDAVAGQGVGSSKFVDAYFPSGVINATAGRREVLIAVAAADGRPNEVFQATLANVSFAQLPLTEGRKQFLVTFSSNGNVSISG